MAGFLNLQLQQINAISRFPNCTNVRLVFHHSLLWSVVSICIQKFVSSVLYEFQDNLLCGFSVLSNPCCLGVAFWNDDFIFMLQWCADWWSDTKGSLVGSSICHYHYFYWQPICVECNEIEAIWPLCQSYIDHR